MSKNGRGKYWTASMLKRRGWSSDLIRELLPRPHYRMTDGHPVRFWDKEDVLEAEENPRFLSRKGEGSSSRISSKAPTPGVKAACAALEQAWNLEQADASPLWRLAEHYHRALVSRLPAVSKSHMLRSSQATAWLGEFLALEQRCDSKQLPAILKNFLRTGPWLGEYLSHPTAQKIRERYTQVLLAAARQVLADFAQLQPEADVERFLQTRDFPQIGRASCRERV